MNIPGLDLFDRLPLAVRHAIDQRCGVFESAWQAGRPVSVESILASASPAERPALLTELILLDIEYRTAQHDPPQLAEYLARFPDDASLVARLLDCSKHFLIRNPKRSCSARISPCSRRHSRNSPAMSSKRNSDAAGWGSSIARSTEH